MSPAAVVPITGPDALSAANGLRRGRGWESPAAWGIWLLMTGLALGLVAAFGFRLPFADEWRWLPVVAGNEPIDMPWVTGFVNEHRFILPKLVYIGLIWLTGADFRAGCFFSVAVLSAAAAMLMVTAGRQRGWTRLPDAFFPLVLLHWAQIDNLTWGFQIHFPMAVAMILAVLAILVGLGELASARTALAIAGCLLAAALSGPYGQAFLPPFGCWLLYAAFTLRRSGPGSSGPVLLMLALAGLLVVTIPLLRLGHAISSVETFPGSIPREYFTLPARLAVAVEFLANGFGPAAKQLWPVSGLLVVGACLASVWQLTVVLRRRPADRLRAAGMLAVLAGVASVALVIGWTRSFLGPQAGFENRYITLLIPLVCLFYLQCQVFASDRGRQIQNALFALMCVLAVFDGFKGLRTAADRQTQFEVLRGDARAGIPVADLALRYTEENFILVRPEEFAGWLEILRERGWYPFDPAATPRDPALAICPMVAVASAYEAPGRVRIAVGERFVQRFRMPQGGRLQRIDLQLGKWRWRRSVDEFQWRLRSADAPAGSPALAEGRFDYRQCTHYPWTMLPISSLPVEARQDLELVVEVPADAPKKRYLEIPLYAELSPGGVQKIAKPEKTENPRDASKVSKVPGGAEEGKMRAMLVLRLPGKTTAAISLLDERLFH